MVAGSSCCLSYATHDQEAISAKHIALKVRPAVGVKARLEAWEVSDSITGGRAV